MNGSSVRGLYTVVEAAQLVDVGRSTMYELVSRGEVASIRLGRKVLITRSTLEALLVVPEVRVHSVRGPVTSLQRLHVTWPHSGWSSL